MSQDEANQSIFFNFPGLSLVRKDITSMSQLLLNEIKKFKPDSIFTHCVDDLHHDHRSTSEAVMIAARPSVYNKSIKNIAKTNVGICNQIKKNSTIEKLNT